MWWLMAHAAVAARAAQIASEDSCAAYRRELEQRTGITTMKMGQPPEHKCPCCGSRTFVERAAGRICAYCRSEQ